MSYEDILYGCSIAIMPGLLLASVIGACDQAGRDQVRRVS
jgi:hypothetical protein